MTFTLKHRLRSSLWFIPVMCVLGGVALSAATIALDRHFNHEIIPKSLIGGPDAALQILATIAASMVNLTTLVLTITMVVVQLATGQYSPRIVRPFLHDRPSQLAIGIFVATFAHAVMTMREVVTTEQDAPVPGLAIAVAFVLVVISIMVLVVYVHHIGQSLTVSGIIESVSQETHKLLHSQFNRSLTPDEQDPKVVCANTSGVVFHLDVDILVEEARKSDCVLRLVPNLGSFVPFGGVLLRVENGEPARLDRDKLYGAISIGAERTLNDDVAYGLRMLVDIAVRSSSDAMNDPTTAVQAIDRLHDNLRWLARAEFPTGEYTDEDGEVRLRVPVLSWDGFVALAFDEIRHVGSRMPQITRRLEEALVDLRSVAPPSRQPAIERQLELLHEDLRGRLSDSQVEVWLTPDRQGIGSAGNLQA